jgi:hypothetical protein
VETARLAARVGTARGVATSQQQSLQHLLEARRKAQAELDKLNQGNAAAEQMVGGQPGSNRWDEGQVMSRMQRCTWMYVWQ